MFAVSSAGSLAAPPSYVVSGNCRDGQPHGAYELRMPDGTLRVTGAFARGKRTGSFLYWSSSGVRIALLPYDDDVMNGTVALWYLVPGGKAEPRSKLEAVYANGQHAGLARSWYPSGSPRAEFRYDHGILLEARAWTTAGKPMPDLDARALAQRDVTLDTQFYNTLEAIVRDNPPPCTTNGRKP
jgi:antitoxin component YwqK of YwqJK toxin-antitoxin module